jgi:hypothetical protein
MDVTVRFPKIHVFQTGFFVKKNIEGFCENPTNILLGFEGQMDGRIW